jgi:tetratricopeptide (TPR) repeat protein
MGLANEFDLFPLEREVQAANELLSERSDWNSRLYVAWGLRQVNSPLALALATDLQAELEREVEQVAFVDPAALSHMRGRLLLIQAEVAILMMRLEEAEPLLARARAEFDSYPNPAALADLQNLRASVHVERGEVDAHRDAMQSAVDLADQAQDSERQLYYRASLARSDLFRDFELARVTWSEQLPQGIEGLTAQCCAALADYRALEHGLASDYLEAARWLNLAYDASLESGQVRRAIAVASNQGYTYTNIADFETALAWLKKGLALARKVRWPGSIGMCLAHTGDALRRVGQTGSARDLLRECLQTLSQHPNNHTSMLALNYLGQTELDEGHFEVALKHFEMLGEREMQSHASDIRNNVVLGRARALMNLNRLDEAREVALEAAKAAAAQQQKSSLVELRQVLAEIEKRSGGTPESVLYWLNLALEQAQALEGFQTPPSLLDAAAAALDQAARPQEAYAMARQAASARQTSWNIAAKHARQQIEIARNERQHARALAHAKETRMNKLQAAHDDLQQLVILSRELWRQPSPGMIFNALSRALRSVLGVELLASYRPDAAGQALQLGESSKGEHEGLPLSVALNDPQHPCAACSRDWTERQLLLPSGATRIFAPMVGDDATPGVLVMDLAGGQAWGAREQGMLRHLSTDAALAFKRALV